MPVTLLATLYCYWLTIRHLWQPVTIDQKAGLAQEIGCCSSLIGWESNKAPPLHYDWLVKTIPHTHLSEWTDNSPLQPHHQRSTGNSKKLEHYNTVSIQLLPVDSYTQCKTTWYGYDINIHGLEDQYFHGHELGKIICMDSQIKSICKQRVIVPYRQYLVS